MQRLAGLCSVLFIMSLLAGCAGVTEQEIKPVAVAPPSPLSAMKNTREFFNSSASYITIGSATQVMDSLENLEPKRQALLKKNPGKDAAAQDKGGKAVEGDELEVAIYRMYLQADTNQNGEIDEGEARAFKNIYMAGFNARVGAIKY